MQTTRRSFLGLTGGALLTPGAAWAARSPLTIFLDTHDGRRCQTLVWRARRTRGTILFSHGALSAPLKYLALIEPWVAAGFDVWAPLHVDSTDHPETKRYPGLASWPARIEDMRAVAAAANAARYVAAGHSYGALVALTLGGARPIPPNGITGPLADPRAKSVLAFSPPGPGMGLIETAGYAALAVPALVTTGTRDIPPGASANGWRAHLAAYEAAGEGGDRYALVLDGADHYFGGLICRPELPGPRQQPQFDIAQVRSLAFLRGYALGDAPVRATLQKDAQTSPAMVPGFYRR